MVLHFNLQTTLMRTKYLVLQKFLTNFATKLQKCAFAVSRQIEGAKNDNTLFVYEIKREVLPFIIFAAPINLHMKLCSSTILHFRYFPKRI